MSQLFNFISALGAPFNMVATVVLIFALMAVIGAVTAMIANVAKECRKYACHRQEIDFKRELIERGMTVDEVARLIAERQEEK